MVYPAQRGNAFCHVVLQRKESTVAYPHQRVHRSWRFAFHCHHGALGRVECVSAALPERNIHCYYERQGAIMSFGNHHHHQGAPLCTASPAQRCSRNPALQESQTRISDFLNVSWNVVYYITNAQGWFLLQVQQAYNDAGQFTRWGRFRQALKENVAVGGGVADAVAIVNIVAIVNMLPTRLPS
jgi:hypothetical protein